MTSSPSSTLKHSLRHTLQNVLADVSLDDDMMGTAPGLPVRASPVVTRPINASASLTNLGLLPASAMGPSDFGLTSRDLLLVSAAEKAMLEQAKAHMLRQQVLAQQTFQQQHYGQSLFGLFHQGYTGYVGGNSLLSQIKNSENIADPKGTLEVLGKSLRNKNSAYVDVSALSDPDPKDTTVRKARGGVTEPFPEKLHRMLKEVEENCDSDIISFFPHGRAFAVHKPDRFVAEIMPKYFKQSRLSSFQRQLNLYGFTRITSGPDSGGYYHELFLKGRPALSVHMRRVGVPQGEDRRKLREKNMCNEPDFYSMASVTTATK